MTVVHAERASEVDFDGLRRDEARLLDLLSSNPRKVSCNLKLTNSHVYILVCIQIPSEMNKNQLDGWTAVMGILKEYKTVGLQIWKHSHYADYKCSG